MTIFSGIINLHASDLETEKTEALKEIMRKNIKEKITYEFNENTFYCIGFDSNAYKSSGLEKDNESFTLIVGDPVLDERKNSRNEDIKKLHLGFKRGERNLLTQTRGVFSGIHFNYKNNECYFFTDKLGIRPLYYYIDSKFFMFSSVLSYIENLSFVNLEADLMGFYEYAAFGYPLFNRTPYKNIKLLLGAEIITLKNGQISSEIYWDFGKIENQSNNDVDIDKIAENAFNVFDDAIKVRIEEENALAFLSGGLDSRCVTAALKKHTKTLQTFNFSTVQSQDAEFANLYSKNLGSKHHEIPMEKLYYPNWSQLISESWNAMSDHIDNNEYPKYPNKVWSGDGGSVAVGCVYLNHEMTQLLADGLCEKAVAVFMDQNKISVPSRFLSKNNGVDANALVYESTLEEVQRITNVPDDKKLYIFLMCNDQRRHLNLHFETIGTHKTELMLPFFDGKFLSTIFSVPARLLIEHDFYMEWFGKFPEFSRISPWQTYPGHKKCDLAIPSNLSYQWATTDKKNSQHDLAQMKKDADDVLKILFQNRAVRKNITLTFVCVAALLHRYGVKDYSYLMSFFKKMDTYFKNMPHNYLNEQP
ncbi:MAG: asparagine synthase-related protein [Methylococcaceae bacterium]